MSTLRTKQSEEEYQKNKDIICPLCERESIHKFKYSKIIQNNFPYDKIAKIHHMIVPFRHVTENELTGDELVEFNEIKQKYLYPEYEYLIESSMKKKSIPEHFHLHLIVSKD